MKAERDYSRRGTLTFLIALLPLLFSVGCSYFYIVEVSNFTDAPVVVELSQYRDFYGKRPTEFTADLLYETKKVRIGPGETAEVKFDDIFDWIVWRQVEPASDAASGVLSLRCDCLDVTLGQKTWRQVTPSEWGARAYRLLARPVGYVATAWFVLLLLRPRWALSRRWSPIRVAVSRSTAYYRLSAAAALMVLGLFVFLPQQLGTPRVARILILLTAVPLFTIWWLAAAARVLLPRAVLENDSWFGRGFPGFQRRIISARAAAFATLLIATISTWTTFFVIKNPLATRVEPNLAPYESFYASPLAEQRRAILHYSIEEQLEIYFVGERKCFGSELERELALNAAEVAPLLAERFAQTKDFTDRLNTLDLLAWLEGSGSYAVADDHELMRVLDDAIADVKGEEGSYSYEYRVEDIREHGERRRIAASVDSPTLLE